MEIQRYYLGDAFCCCCLFTPSDHVMTRLTASLPYPTTCSNSKAFWSMYVFVLVGTVWWLV